MPKIRESFKQWLSRPFFLAGESLPAARCAVLIFWGILLTGLCIAAAIGGFPLDRSTPQLSFSMLATLFLAAIAIADLVEIPLPGTDDDVSETMSLPLLIAAATVLPAQEFAIVAAGTTLFNGVAMESARDSWWSQIKLMVSGLHSCMAIAALSFLFAGASFNVAPIDNPYFLPGAISLVVAFTLFTFVEHAVVAMPLFRWMLRLEFPVMDYWKSSWHENSRELLVTPPVGALVVYGATQNVLAPLFVLPPIFVVSHLLRARRELDVVREEVVIEREAAQTDPLTKLLNRRGFDERSAHVEDGCLIAFDIDHFKKFNDTYGHSTGDRVLTLVADCIRAAAPEGSLPTRLGGEELALLLPGADRTSSLALAEQLRHTIENSLPGLKVTTSIGVAQLSTFDLPAGEGPLKRTLEQADKALYAAKEAGRNQVWAWNHETEKPEWISGSADLSTDQVA